MRLKRRRSSSGRWAGYFKDPQVPLWRKLVGLFAAVYVALPADVIPDVLPILGWLDDLGVLSAAAWFILREVKRHAQRHELPQG